MKARVPTTLPAVDEQKQEAANEKSNRKMLNYAHRSLLISAHNVLGYGGTRLKRQAFLFYANEMSHLCRTMICMGLVELHQNGGVGAERMERVVGAVREDWFRLMRVYLAMDSAGVVREQKAMLGRFNALGCFPEEVLV